MQRRSHEYQRRAFHRWCEHSTGDECENLHARSFWQEDLLLLYGTVLHALAKRVLWGLRLQVRNKATRPLVPDDSRQLEGSEQSGHS